MAVLLVVAGVIELLLLAFPDDSAQAEETTELPSVVQVADSRTHVEYFEVRKQLDAEVQWLCADDAIIVDGVPLSPAMAERLIIDQGDYASSVLFIDQRPLMPSGCELIALSAILQAEGLAGDPRQIADSYLRIGTQVATEYLGDPMVNGGGLAPSVVAAANGWLNHHEPDARAYNLTGTTFDGLMKLVDLGYPVAVWVTEDLSRPVFVGAVQDGLQWYNKEHCVVICGQQGDEVQVADSLVGMVYRPKVEMARVYDECRRMAMFVDPGSGV